MYTKWTQHLKTPEEQLRFETHVRSASSVLERLEQLIQEELDGLEKAELSTKIYDSPNWDYKIAHGNGFKAALGFVKKLIDLDQQKDTNDRQSITGRSNPTT